MELVSKRPKIQIGEVSVQNVRVKNTNRNDLRRISLTERLRSGVTELFRKAEDNMHQPNIPGVENENTLVREINNNKYTLKSSNSSFRLRDVEGFVYGGLSSRFWIFRKHFNMMEPKDFNRETVPFFSWECLTIHLHNRHIDIVIRDETQMMNMICLLVYHINTVDGDKDSSLKIMQTLIDQEQASYLRKNKLKEFKPGVKEKIEKQVRHRVMREVRLKYMILRIRAKISFIAFEQKKTILELFVNQIRKSYLLIWGDPDGTIQRIHQQFADLVNKTSNFSKFIIRLNMELGHVKNKALEDSIKKKDREESQKEKAMNVCEEIQVKRKEDGIIKKHMINHHENHAKKNKIIVMLDKNNCFDIFQNSKTESDHFLEQVQYKEFLKYKFNKKNRQKLYQKLMLMMKVGALHSQLFTIAILQLIKLSKEVFMIDLEQGYESFIPKELSQDHLPMSFRYYDPIFHIVDDLFDD